MTRCPDGSINVLLHDVSETKGVNGAKAKTLPQPMSLKLNGLADCETARAPGKIPKKIGERSLKVIENKRSKVCQFFGPPQCY
jgi:hypothetical protein